LVIRRRDDPNIHTVTPGCAVTDGAGGQPQADSSLLVPVQSTAVWRLVLRWSNDHGESVGAGFQYLPRPPLPAATAGGRGGVTDNTHRRSGVTAAAHRFRMVAPPRWSQLVDHGT